MILPLVSPLCQAIGMSILRGNGKGPAQIPITTANFSSAQYVLGLTGSISTTKNAARVYGRAGISIWAGVITGSEAKLTVTSESGNLAGLIAVAIDGGAFVDASNVGSLWTLFSGLPHASRFVEIRYGAAFGNAPYIASSGNVLQVKGQPPSIAPITDWAQLGADSATSFSNAPLTANVATYTPQLSAGKGNTYGSAIANIKIKGAFKTLYVAMNGDLRKVGVSKNGQAPTFYSAAGEANKPLRVLRIPCDGSDSTYFVWDDGCGRTSGGHFSVAGDAVRQDVGMQRRIDQYGDSITFGTGPGATPADVETMPVAAALDYVGSTYGIGGYTIAQCLTLLDTVLPVKTVTQNDVAILTIGRNNVPDITAQDAADYSACIDKLVAKGYGKVLCRGVLPVPNGSQLWTAENAALKAVVTEKSDSKVVWVPTETWLGWGTADNTHPNAAGYITLAGHATPAYNKVLSAPPIDFAMMIGSSSTELTFGDNIYGRQEQPARKALSEAGLDVPIINAGVGGNVIVDVRNRLPALLTELARWAATGKKGIAIVVIGANNIGVTDYDNMDPVKLAAMRDDLTYIITQLKTSGHQVLLAASSSRKSFNPLYQEWAEKFYLPLVKTLTPEWLVSDTVEKYGILKTYLDYGESVPNFYYSDNLHPRGGVGTVYIHANLARFLNEWTSPKRQPASKTREQFIFSTHSNITAITGGINIITNNPSGGVDTTTVFTDLVNRKGQTVVGSKITRSGPTSITGGTVPNPNGTDIDILNSMMHRGGCLTNNAPWTLLFEPGIAYAGRSGTIKLISNSSTAGRAVRVAVAGGATVVSPTTTGTFPAIFTIPFTADEFGRVQLTMTAAASVYALLTALEFDFN